MHLSDATTHAVCPPSSLNQTAREHTIAGPDARFLVPSADRTSRGGALVAVGDIVDFIRAGAADVAIAALKRRRGTHKAVLGAGGSPVANQPDASVFDKQNQTVDAFIRGHAAQIGGAAPAGGAALTGYEAADIWNNLESFGWGGY